MEQKSKRPLASRATALALSFALAVGLCPGVALAAQDSGALKSGVVSYTIEKVKYKSSYKETFKLSGSKHNATYKTSTKKVYRKVNGDKLYAATLTKYTGKSTKYDAEVASVVVYLDKRFSEYDEMPEANVTAISPKAFKGCKAKSLAVYSRFLTKKGVKNSLKGSQIKTVEVPKSCLKKYKKYFSKANCGKKVTVKAFTGKLKNWPKGDWVPDNATADNAFSWILGKISEGLAEIGDE